MRDLRRDDRLQLIGGAAVAFSFSRGNQSALKNKKRRRRKSDSMQQGRRPAVPPLHIGRLSRCVRNLVMRDEGVIAGARIRAPKPEDATSPCQKRTMLPSVNQGCLSFLKRQEGIKGRIVAAPDSGSWERRDDHAKRRGGSCCRSLVHHLWWALIRRVRILCPPRPPCLLPWNLCVWPWSAGRCRLFCAFCRTAICRFR